MNKNDFRVQLPLWNIALFSILMIWFYGIVYMVDQTFADFEDILIEVNGNLTVNFHLPSLLSIIIGFFLIIIFFIAYFMRLNRHNQMNPDQKLKPFYLLKPGEFLADDEMLRQVTENATKKIYILYDQAIPIIIFTIVMLPFNRYIYIVMLFSLLIIQHALYYRDIRKFFSEIEE